MSYAQDRHITNSPTSIKSPRTRGKLMRAIVASNDVALSGDESRNLPPKNAPLRTAGTKS